MVQSESESGDHVSVTLVVENKPSVGFCMSRQDALELADALRQCVKADE